MVEYGSAAQLERYPDETWTLEFCMEHQPSKIPGGKSPKLAIQVSSIFLLNENRRNPVSTGMGESHAYVMPSKGSDQS